VLRLAVIKTFLQACTEMYVLYLNEENHPGQEQKDGAYDTGHQMALQSAHSGAGKPARRDGTDHLGSHGMIKVNIITH
jgi:hypothetical protein